MILERTLTVGLLLLFASASLLPYQFLPPGGLPGAVRLVPPALALGTLTLWYAGRLRVGKPFPSDIPLSVPVALYILFDLLGCLCAQDTKLALSRLGYYTVTGTLLYLVSADTFGKGRARRFAAFAVSVAAVVALYGVVEFVVNSNPLSGSAFNPRNPAFARFGGVPGGRPRISATVGHPVYVAAYLVMALPLALHLALELRSWVLRVLSASAFLSILSALVLTFSRGGWLGAAVGVLSYLGHRGRRGLLSGALGISVAVGVVLASGEVRRIVKSRDPLRYIALELSSRPPGGRLDAYRVAGEIASRRPLFGVGTANYRLVAGRYGDVNETPDNMYLRLIYENGLLGFGAAMFLFFGMLSRLRRGGDLSRAFLAAMVGFLVDMVTNDALAFPTTRIAFWLLAGAGMGSRLAPGQPSQERPEER